MVLLDASARNVGSYLVFAASRRDACSHSDLGYAKLSQIRSERKRHPSDGQQCVRARKALLSREPRCSLGHLVRHAQRQPFLPPGLRSSVSRSPHGSAQQADASPQEHTHASVWIATSFRPRPRMHKHANVWWSMQLHELCALHTDSLFPVALAAVLSSCAATVEPSLVRGTAQRHRNGPAWASNDALSKALARTRVPQHLATCTPDCWAPTHTFVEPGHERLPLES
jgi:hypothetical protein